MTFRRILRGGVLPLLAVAAWWCAPGVAQDRSTADVSPDVLLAEGVYADEFLRDPAGAADWYRRVLDHPQATRTQRQRATWRLARSERRLNHPTEARVLLSTLLLDPELPDDRRRRAEAELALIPRADPARLMSDDTLVYAEVPQPGIFLERVLALLDQARLENWAREAVLAPLRRAGVMDLSGFWNEAVRAELSKLDTLGVGWRNFRFTPMDGEQVEALSDVLLVLHTGGSVATAGVLEGVVTGLLSRQIQYERVRFFAPIALDAGPHFAVADGLFVMCAHPGDGVKAVQRYRGELTGDTLQGVSAFRRRPPGWPESDAIFLYVDWAGLVRQVLGSQPADRAAYLTDIADALQLRTLGPIFASAALRDDRLELDVAIESTPAAGPAARVAQTPPLGDGWRRWVPQDAWAALALRAAPGAERWRQLEDFLARIADWGADAPPATTQPTTTDPRDAFRLFEEATDLSLAEDVFADIDTVVIIGLPPVTNRPSEPLQWVLVLEVEDAAQWMRRLEIGLSRYLFGELGDKPLPTIPVDTPIGEVSLLAVPRTRFGLAWQVRDGHILAAFGVGTLVSYVESLNEPSDAPLPPEPGISKFLMLRVDRLSAHWRGVGTATSPPLPPLTAASYELAREVRLVIRQDRLADVVRTVVAHWTPDILDPR